MNRVRTEGMALRVRHFAPACILVMAFAGPAIAKSTYIEIDVPGAIKTYATFINNNSAVTGTWTDSAGIIMVMCASRTVQSRRSIRRAPRALV